METLTANVSTESASKSFPASHVSGVKRPASSTLATNDDAGETSPHDHRTSAIDPVVVVGYDPVRAETSQGPSASTESTIGFPDATAMPQEPQGPQTFIPPVMSASAFSPPAAKRRRAGGNLPVGFTPVARLQSPICVGQPNILNCQRVVCPSGDGIFSPSPTIHGPSSHPLPPSPAPYLSFLSAAGHLGLLDRNAGSDSSQPFSITSFYPPVPAASHNLTATTSTVPTNASTNNSGGVNHGNDVSIVATTAPGTATTLPTPQSLPQHTVGGGGGVDIGANAHDPNNGFAIPCALGTATSLCSVTRLPLPTRPITAAPGDATDGYSQNLHSPFGDARNLPVSPSSYLPSDITPIGQVLPTFSSPRPAAQGVPCQNSPSPKCYEVNDWREDLRQENKNRSAVTGANGRVTYWSRQTVPPQTPAERPEDETECFDDFIVPPCILVEPCQESLMLAKQAESAYRRIEKAFNIDPRWNQILMPLLSSDLGLRTIREYERRCRIETVLPPRKDVFAWTRYCAPQDVKVIIVGQDPYHRRGQAHGLAFSVNKGVDAPPSLRNILKAVKYCYPQAKFQGHGNLSQWAQQGVLLINAVFTVKEGAPDSHKGLGWTAIVRSVLNYFEVGPSGMVYMLWGAHANRVHTPKGKRHLVLKYSHPSPLSRRPFGDCQHFKQANEYLKAHGKDPIDWSLL